MLEEMSGGGGSFQGSSPVAGDQGGNHIDDILSQPH